MTVSKRLVALALLVAAYTLFVWVPLTPAKAEEGNTWGIAAINDYIDKANVLIGDRERDFCSGTVISIKDRLILSADHCVSDRVRQEVKEFVDPDTGEITKKTIEKKLDLMVSRQVVKDYEVVSRQSFTAKIWARDPEHDVAILQIIDPSYVPVYEAKLAPDDYKIRRGETVYVVGNPGGVFDNSLTKGIISATERTLEFDDGKKVRVFQLDAAAIGGNSGGSVLNEKGQIVGTVDAILRGSSITFAVPISITKELLKKNAPKPAEPSKKQDRVPEKKG